MAQSCHPPMPSSPIESRRNSHPVHAPTNWIDELNNNIERSTDTYVIQGDPGPGRPFVGEHVLRRKWTEIFEYRREILPKSILASKRWILNDDSASERCLVFASILVSVRWQNWDEFPQLILDEHQRLRRKDSDLPLRSSQDVDFLYPRQLRVLFLGQQYTYLPPFIRLRETVVERIVVTSNHPLPFTEENLLSHPAYSTPQSKVTRVRVARGYCSGLPVVDDFPNEPLYLARKRCDAKEHQTMEKLRNHLKKHDRIVQSFCTVEIGQDFSILLPWADGGDLHHALHNDTEDGARDAFLRRGASKIEAPAPETLTAALLREARNLVSAIVFLHSEDFEDLGGKSVFYHMDLKLNNVLVFFKQYPRSSIGRWKVADFGLSVFHQLSSTMAGASQTTTLRPHGAFQPPEVDENWSKEKGRPEGVNQKGDVWSLGAILCYILAYTLGGSAVVNILDAARYPASTATGGEAGDFFYRIDSHTGRPQLKGRVVTWLGEVADDHPRSVWICGIVTLLCWSLNVEAGSRPTAKKLCKRLDDVIQELTQPGTTRSRPSWLQQALESWPRISSFDTRSAANQPVDNMASPQAPPPTEITSSTSSGYRQAKSGEIRDSSATSYAADARADDAAKVVDFVLLGKKENCLISMCPVSANVAVVTKDGTRMMRLHGNASRERYTVSDLGILSNKRCEDVIMRIPYCALITRAKDSDNQVR
jgi:serine/threonine protein kinase